MTSTRRGRQTAAVLLQAFLIAQTTNPFAGRPLYVDPNSLAKRQAETWKRSRPADAELVARIANQPMALWLGSWVTNVQREVNQAVTTITGAGALPVFVAYNIPHRDCGSYSAGGLATATAYSRWIEDMALGIRSRRRECLH